MILVEIGSADILVIFVLILGAMFGPPLTLLLMGLSRRKKDPKDAKKLYILAVVYLIISGGICATMMN